MINCSGYIPVVFAINNDYVQQLSVSLISMLENSSKENKFIINILSTNISDKNKNIIKYLNYLNNNTQFNFIDATQLVEKFNIENYMSRRKNYNYISIETYFRFFIAELLPQYDKVIYLDADLIIMDDLSKLYNFNIDDYAIGAIQDMNTEISVKHENFITSKNLSVREYFLNILKKKSLKYFNAGVLLLNLKKFREENILNELLEFTEQNSPLEFQDQDILNVVLEERVKYLDSKWNLLKDLDFYISYQNDKNRIKEIKKCFKNPGIIHYIGENKPWLYKEKFWYSFEGIKLWWKYYRMSPLYNSKNELILKAINYERFAKKWFTYIDVSLFNHTIIRIRQSDKRLKFELFFIKITLKLNKYEKLDMGI